MKTIFYLIFLCFASAVCFAEDPQTTAPFNMTEAQFYFMCLGVLWAYYIIVKILFCKNPKSVQINKTAQMPEDLSACELSALLKKGFSASNKLLLMHFASMLNSKAISIEAIVPEKKSRGTKYLVTALDKDQKNNEEKNWADTFPKVSISSEYDEKLMLYEKHFKEDLCEQIEKKYINKNKRFLWGGSIPFILLLVCSFYCETMTFLLLFPTGLFTFFFAPYLLRTYNEAGAAKVAQCKALKSVLSDKRGAAALSPDQINALYAYAIALNIEKQYEKNFEYLLTDDLKAFAKYRENLYFVYQGAVTVPYYDRRHHHSLITINLGKD